MGMDWEWVLEFIINIGITKAIPLLFNEIIEYFRLSACSSIDKSSMVIFMEDENMVYVHHEELVVGILHQWLVYTMLSMDQISYTINILS